MNKTKLSEARAKLTESLEAGASFLELRQVREALFILIDYLESESEPATPIHEATKSAVLELSEEERDVIADKCWANWIREASYIKLVNEAIEATLSALAAKRPESP